VTINIEKADVVAVILFVGVIILAGLWGDEKDEPRIQGPTIQSSASLVDGKTRPRFEYVRFEVDGQLYHMPILLFNDINSVGPDDTLRVADQTDLTKMLWEGPAKEFREMVVDTVFMEM